MSDALWEKLIDIVPALAWVAFALVVFLSLRRPLIGQILPRISTIKAPGLELTLVGELLAKASESTEESSGPTLTATERQGVLRRVDHAAEYLKGGRILWVDDHPRNNKYLIDLFRQTGMSVDTARSTEEALRLLKSRSYDLVLSDMERDGDHDAGLRMVEAFRQLGSPLPVVIHSVSFSASHRSDSMIFASSGRVDEVIHYVIDIMERIRLSESL